MRHARGRKMYLELTHVVVLVVIHRFQILVLRRVQRVSVAFTGLDEERLLDVHEPW